MANAISVVALNRGLDQVTPPLAVQQGSLVDCLNYEMTDIAGYRRIDGYERYDGYPNGAIYEYFNVSVEAVDPANQYLITPGAIISRLSSTAPKKDIGVILANTSTAYYDVTPTEDIEQFILTESFIYLSDGESFLAMSDGLDLLKLDESGDDTLGSTFQVTTTSGTSFAVEVSSTPVSGRATATASAYLTKLREYSEILRALVTDMPTAVAGLYWFEDRLLAAIDTTEMTLAGASTPPVNSRVRWNGTIYRVLEVEEINTNEYILHLATIEESATVDDTLVSVDSAGTTGTTWIADVSASSTVSTSNSTYAQMIYCNNPNISTIRGITYLPIAQDFEFSTGKSTLALGPALTLEDGDDASDVYYAVASGKVLKLRLTKVVQEDGTWSVGDVTGKAQATVIEVIDGTVDYLESGDVIHTAYPTTSTSAAMTIPATPVHSKIAGTGSLRGADTRYVWSTLNFYGQSTTLTAYGTTGAGRAFWANENGYGVITAHPTESKDKPKYLAFHAGKLALGYAKGSVLFSVAGEPYNFEGAQGAIEVATGDAITGLVELPGETLAVFGRRSIRKITGSTDSDTELGTLVPKSSCFDYTAMSIGQDAVFTGVHGISTLQQSNVYGDFQGENISDPISTWLRPKLNRTRPGFEVGGIICAYPVRTKGQYRLVLATGEVVVATFTQEGPKLTIAKWAPSGQTRVPFAWSSEVSSEGVERIHVSWAAEDLRNRIIEMDTGWGFDGKVFKHYFDLAHIFADNMAYAMSVEKCRLHGQGYGVASLDIKSSGIEDDFFQPFHDTVQDISLPRNAELLYDRMLPVTSSVDLANWGIGIKLRIQGSTAENSTETEPSHICQVIVLKVKTEGAQDL